MAVLLLVGWTEKRSGRQPAKPVAELTQQADWAYRPADAVLDGLHMGKHDRAGGVQQRLGHVEDARWRRLREACGKACSSSSPLTAKMTRPVPQFDYLGRNGMREVRVVDFPP